MFITPSTPINVLRRFLAPMYEYENPDQKGALTDLPEQSDDSGECGGQQSQRSSAALKLVIPYHTGPRASRHDMTGLEINTINDHIID